MNAGPLEIEVKLPVGAPDEARRLLAPLGAATDVPRTFEDNLLFDTPRGELRRDGRVLRLRSFGERIVVTYKEPPAERDAAAAGMKVVTEHECLVSSKEQMRAILEGLGFVKVYRYQKYREERTLPGLTITLDETPIGTFLELEGLPDRIREVASALGMGPESYVAESYRALHAAWCARTGQPFGDMVFAESVSP